MIFHEDNRAQRLLDIFDLKDGQLNISYINSTNHIVAWHMHHIQTDYWMCIKGSIQVGLKHISGPVKWNYLSDKNPTKFLKIPPYTYHGYKALEPSILLYFLDEKYNPTDEYNVLPGTFDEDWSTPNK